MNKINLIGICGKKKSGKDTVAKMIQYLTICKNREIMNKKFLAFDPTWAWATTDWELKSFAYKIKQIASILTGIPVDKFEDREFKSKPMANEWIKFMPEGDRGQYTYRQLLQIIGTECMRNNLHENTWINALWVGYKEESTVIHKLAGEDVDEDYEPQDSDIIYNYPNWIITDCRFINEAQSIKDRRGIVIKLTRNLDSTDTHQSEKEVELIEADYIIDNKDKTIEETLEDVKKILTELKII